ncbi:DUF6093 family protein [Glycomyces sp. NPDC021274]|uniref:DUF6093 family protein n=1 Tax=Glycomyces sp. NPDC021274 TaxID=3155120 RepID=UPI0033EAC4DF
MPFPGTGVFHRDWEARNRPVAESAMTATGIVRRYSATGVFNEPAGKTDYPPPVTVYGVDGAARMRVVRDGVETTREIGGQQVIIRNYIVVLPADAPEIRVNDEVVVATAGDARLPDESLWVHDVRFGSQIWERDLVCANVPPAQI